MQSTNKEILEKPFRIAHISDIHLGKAFDEALWSYIKDVLQTEKPKIIVVSGDIVNSPWPLKLLQAKKELYGISKDIGADLILVPGNHDVTLFGNLKIWPFSKFFEEFFKSNNNINISNIPSQIEFKGLGRFRKSLRWLKAYTKICRYLASWMVDRLIKKELVPSYPKFYKKNDVLIVALNSNDKGLLATGYVNDSSVYNISKEIKRIPAKKCLAEILSPRIAVLHHHPVPIPYSIVKEHLTSFEPFLVLRNSGTLLKELWDHNFDLVLHGHKHYHNFTRIEFDGFKNEGSQMGLLASGSTSVRLEEAGRNSLNIIDVHPNTRISIKPFFFGGGRTAKENDRNGKPDCIYIHSRQGLKMRNYYRSLQFQKIECNEIERKVVINEFGSYLGVGPR